MVRVCNYYNYMLIFARSKSFCSGYNSKNMLISQLLPNRLNW